MASTTRHRAPSQFTSINVLLTREEKALLDLGVMHAGRSYRRFAKDAILAAARSAAIDALNNEMSPAVVQTARLEDVPAQETRHDKG